MVGLRATVLGRLGSLTPNHGGGWPILPIVRLYGSGQHYSSKPPARASSYTALDKNSSLSVCIEG